MATIIYFTASRGDQALTLNVHESPGDVYGKLIANSSNPSVFKHTGGGEVYVQPANIAFWREAGGGAASF
jgi:hypothetical protein